MCLVFGEPQVIDSHSIGHAKIILLYSEQSGRPSEEDRPQPGFPGPVVGMGSAKNAMREVHASRRKLLPLRNEDLRDRSSIHIVFFSSHVRTGWSRSAQLTKRLKGVASPKV